MLYIGSVFPNVGEGVRTINGNAVPNLGEWRVPHTSSSLLRRNASMCSGAYQGAITKRAVRAQVWA